MAMIHVSRSGQTLGVFEEEKVREGLRTGEFIGTDLGWTEGMPNWRPLSELESFRTPPPPQAAVPPVAAQPLVTGAIPAAEPAQARTGLPWENRAGRSIVEALTETVTLIFTKPDKAFSIMRREGGFGDPLLYILILGTIAGVISLGFSFGLKSLGIFADRNNGFGALAGMGFGFIGLLIFIPFAIVIGSFIAAAITHLCLMIVGGAKQPFETTYRVICFGGGTGSLLQIVPLCGGFLGAIASLVLNCIGLARAHETDTWRAVVAILLPMVVCCGGAAVLFMVIIGAAAAGNWH